MLIASVRNIKLVPHLGWKMCIRDRKYLGLIPYDEQLTAAAELTKGRITEMKTGEGKTLCAAFAASYMAKKDVYKRQV